MRTARPSLAYLITAVLALTCATFAADQEKPKRITLEDVIFDVTYLKKLLGPKTLVTAVVETNRGRKKTDTDLAEGIKAIKQAQLDEHTQIFSLPDDATQPELKSSAPHIYPPGLNLTRAGKQADFLMLIGADGVVKCLYCYHHNDRLFALAAAMAVVKWRYEPAKIQGVAVPVLARLPMSIEPNEVSMTDPSRRKLERQLPVSKFMKPATPSNSTPTPRP